MYHPTDFNHEINSRLTSHWMIARQCLVGRVEVQDVTVEILRWLARLFAGDYWIALPEHREENYSFEIESQELVRRSGILGSGYYADLTWKCSSLRGLLVYQAGLVQEEFESRIQKHVFEFLARGRKHNLDYICHTAPSVYAAEYWARNIFINRPDASNALLQNIKDYVLTARKNILVNFKNEWRGQLHRGVAARLNYLADYMEKYC